MECLPSHYVYAALDYRFTLVKTIYAFIHFEPLRLSIWAAYGFKDTR